MTTQSIRRALERHPDAKALLVINPTYYGVVTDLKEIVELAHSYQVPVLVDEAHGVLIHFHEDLPLSAMAAGADMAATSVHKLGGSMTQSSITQPEYQEWVRKSTACTDDPESAHLNINFIHFACFTRYIKT